MPAEADLPLGQATNIGKACKIYCPKLSPGKCRRRRTCHWGRPQTLEKHAKSIVPSYLRANAGGGGLATGAGHKHWKSMQNLLSQAISGQMPAEADLPLGQATNIGKACKIYCPKLSPGKCR